MSVATEPDQWTALTPARREQLARLLPIEARELLAAPVPPSPLDLAMIRARLEQLWQSIGAMAPRWVVESLGSPAPSFARAGEVTLLFADMTGFTPLTAQLARFGRIGNEYLTHVLNRCFAALVPIGLARGGDLLAFGGDAILVAFDRPGHAAAATIAAWEMQQAIAELSFDDLDLPEPLRLQMKVGLASGPLVLASAGTRARRVAIPLGSVLATTDMMANATAAGGVRLDARAAAEAAAVARLLPQPDGSALLADLRRHPPAEATRPADTPTWSLDQLVARIDALGCYLPESVLASLIAAPHAAPGQGEQRHVVSLFAHLQGLHTLADARWSSEPELVAQAAGLAIGRALELIEGHGGALARVDMYGGGHKLLALFGAPITREQAAARAILAALALRDELPSIAAAVRQQLGEGLDVSDELLVLRCGIGAGLAVAGMVGSPLRWEYTVLGDSVNVAARLMGRAGSGEMLVAADVAATAGARLEAEPLRLELKGKAAPVEAWSVRGLQSGGPAEPSQEPPLVGRAAERAALRELGARLRAGQAGALFLQGEAGIGKSRLARELPALLGPEVDCIQTGSPGLVPVSLGIFRALILQLCAGAPDDPDQLRAAVDELCPGRAGELWPALAVLLGRSAANPAGAGASAEAQQRLLAEAARDLLAGAAGRRPLAWVCEDLHDADDASLAVFEQLLALGWQAPLLVSATIRTTAASAQLAQRLAAVAEQRFADGALVLHLGGLSQDDGGELVDALLPGLAPAARAALQAHTMGNPLFLQALAQLLHQRRMLAPSSQGLQLSGPLAALAVPRTLRELVAAQVDRLPAEARRLAQVAAVIAVADRTVPLWLLEQIAGEPGAVLPRLHALARAQVIELDADDRAPRYAFRHALYQQAAYDQLLERERQELHRRAGAALHEHQDRPEASAEALAYHCYEGRSWELALEYSLAAGRRALQSYANREARRLLRRSLGLARRLSLARHEAEAREGLGALYSLLGRFYPARAHLERLVEGALPDKADSDELEARARRYRLLAEIAEHVGEYDRGEIEAREGLALMARRGSVPERLRLYEQLAIILMRRGNLDSAEEACREGLALLPTESTILTERIALLQLIGGIELSRGNYQSAIEVLEECQPLAEQLNELTLISPILRNLGLGYYLTGHRAKARDRYVESIEIDERVGNIVGVIIANDNLGLVHILNGDYELALACFQKAASLAHAHDLSQRLANITVNLGTLYFVTGDLQLAELTLQQAKDLFVELGEARNLADCLYQMGDVALAKGLAEAAFQYGEQTVAYARQVGSLAYEVYGLRVIGEALLMRESVTEAVKALDLADELQSHIDEPLSRVLLLRARALLLHKQGHFEDAKALAEFGLALATDQSVPYLMMKMRELNNNVGNGYSLTM